MKCGVCQLEGAGPTCSPECFALALVSTLDVNEDERAQSRWDCKRRWHQVRGLAFTEEPPRTVTMRTLEALDLLQANPIRTVAA